MEKAWNIVKMIFASVDRGYLIRSYILGFLYMAIVVGLGSLVGLFGLGRKKEY